jgi:CRISPR-associated endonuclease Csn1
LKHIAELTKIRDAAAQELRNFGVKVTREVIVKYLLWQEQEHTCVYSGRKISVAQLLNGDVDVDHILPYSLCLDDSQMNKVLCFREENAQKGQQTPYQWQAHANPAKYEQVCQRAKKLSYPKYARFVQKEVELDSFIARQLVDTAYIAKVTALYLSCLFDQKSQGVLGLKGKLTAQLRWYWGINNLLAPEADHKVKVREDHRHHAIDAIVIALTNRSRLQGLSRIRKQGRTLVTGEVLPEPWSTFRQDVEVCVNQIQVSHRPSRKVAGGLHEETMYGLHRNDAGQTVANEYVVRKSLEALSANEIPSIRDVAVRDAVIRRLAEHGLEIGRGKAIAPQDMKKLFGDPANPLRLIGKKTGTLGPPIRKVRVIKKEQSIRPIRSGDQTVYVKPGSTHHLSFFEYQENGKTKYDAVWTTMLDAADRLKRQTHALSQIKQKLEAQNSGKKLRKNDPRLIQVMRKIAQDIPLITRVHPERSDAKFLFSLSRGEMVLAQVDGKPQLLVYNTSASTAGQMWFYHHTDARPAKDKKKFSFMVNTLLGKAQARKVCIDYLGRVRWAKD